MKLNRKFTITILIFVMIPMGVILGVLFYNMEQSTIKEHRTYMKNKMERNKTQMETGPPSEVSHRANADRDAFFEALGIQFTRAQLLEQATTMGIKPNTALT